MDKTKLKKAVDAALSEGKGKKKFVQSVELVINFRGIDFTKTDNRLNMDISLPYGKGKKAPKVAVFGDENVGAEARKGGAELTILPGEIPAYSDKEKLKMLADGYVLLAQPNLMGPIAKSMGQYLGPRGKLPKPIIGNVGGLVGSIRKSVRIVSKGKYLPTAHVFVGTEEMKDDEILGNAEAVFESLKVKIPESNLKSAYVKLTMGKPVRII
ncbi:MAG: 50S ribosomal protein L1 [Candidatus Bilamarchaeaceae archaeon]